MKVNNQDTDPGCYIAGHWGQYGIDRLADICDQFGIELLERDRPGYWRERAETAEDNDEPANDLWELHYDAGNRLEDTLNNATVGGYWSWEDGELFLTAASTCVHCGRDILFDPEGGWVDPEADGDDEIWRVTCDAHDTFTAEHEPEET